MTFFRAVVATVGIVLLAGCSGSAIDTDGEGLQDVTIGMLPAAATAAIFVGIEEGFFEAEGLNPILESGQGSAALLPAVVSGQIDFGTGGPVSLLVARDQGLDVRAIAPWTGDAITGNGEIPSANVVIATDPDIKTVLDLAGKTVAVNALRSVGELTLREAMRSAGGDPGQITFVELGFADMPGALAQGNVDGIWTADPFISNLIAGNAHAVDGTLNSDAVPGMVTQVVFTSQTLIDRDPELVEAVARAFQRTLEYVNDGNLEAVRAKVLTVLPQLDPGVLELLNFEGYYDTEIDRAPLERIAELMDLEGWLNAPADIDGLLMR